MHELGMCSSVVDAVVRRAGDRRVRSVRVRVGALHGIQEETFARSFEVAATGTLAEGAEVDVVTVPLRGRCRVCGAEFTTVHSVRLCPECGAPDIEVTGGDEFVVDSVDFV